MPPAGPCPGCFCHENTASLDWHLGRIRFGRKRYDEFAAFQDWQADMIEVYQIDLLPFH
jgi:hypothetical protein